MKTCLVVLFSLLVKLSSVGGSQQSTVVPEIHYGYMREAEVVQPICERVSRKPEDFYKCTLDAYGHKVVLNLEKSSNVPGLMASVDLNYEDSAVEVAMNEVIKKLGVFYEDAENQAALHLRSLDGLEPPILEGYIGDMFIQPIQKMRLPVCEASDALVDEEGSGVPSDTEQESPVQPPALAQENAGCSSKSRSHVVVRSPPVESQPDSSGIGIRSASETSTAKGPLPVVNVEVRVVVLVDYTIYSDFKKNLTATLDYAFKFMDKVQPYFNDMPGLNITINTTYVSVAEDEEDLKYIQKLKIDGVEYVDVLGTLPEMGHAAYLSRFITRTAPDFDVELYLTRTTLCCGGLLDAGGTYGSGMCKYNRNMILYDVGVIRDDSNYLGVETAVKVIAHLLGDREISEDGSDDESEKGCSEEESIFDVTLFTKSEEKPLSSCSSIYIRRFLTSGRVPCLNPYIEGSD